MPDDLYPSRQPSCRLLLLLILVGSPLRLDPDADDDEIPMMMVMMMTSRLVSKWLTTELLSGLILVRSRRSFCWRTVVVAAGGVIGCLGALALK